MAAAAATCGEGADAAPDNLRFVQYFLSRIQDAPACAMWVVDGRMVVQSPTTNAALTCPDMFAWKLFAEAVTAEFWKIGRLIRKCGLEMDIPTIRDCRWRCAPKAGVARVAAHPTA